MILILFSWRVETHNLVWAMVVCLLEGWLDGCNGFVWEPKIETKMVFACVCMYVYIYFIHMCVNVEMQQQQQKQQKQQRAWKLLYFFPSSSSILVFILIFFLYIYIYITVCSKCARSTLSSQQSVFFFSCFILSQKNNDARCATKVLNLFLSGGLAAQHSGRSTFLAEIKNIQNRK